MSAPDSSSPRTTVLPVSRRMLVLLAFLSGNIYWIGFAGADIWPLSFVAYVPLYLAMIGQTPKRAALAGWVMGTALSVGGFYWLYEMLKVFSGFGPPLCILFTLIVCAFQGGRYALAGWLFGRATARHWPRELAFVLTFIASEMAYPLLFPWYFSASVHRVPVLMQTAELFGSVFVGVILVLVNLGLAELVLARLERRAPSLRLLAVTWGTFALSLVFGWVRIRQVDARVAAAESAKVGIIQANMGLKEKRVNYAEGLERHLSLTAQAKAAGVDFVVWSETSVMHAVLEARADAEVKETVGRHIGIPSIVGAVLFRFEPPPKEYSLFNTALALDSEGNTTGRFDKTYLLAFGEYLPFGDTFPVLYKWSPNSGKFTAGTSFDPVILDVGGKKRVVSALICYEDIIPAFTNAVVRKGDPELLVNITNDAWFGDTTEPWEHLALAKFRSVEHRRFLVRSTNSGVSAIVDPVGRTTVQSGTFRQEMLTGTIHWLRGKTLYGLVGDVPMWICTAAAFLLAFVSRKKAAAT